MAGRKFGKLLCSIWDDPDFLALTGPARLLYLALISQPDISAAGHLPITIGRWRTYLFPDATRDDVWTALHELVTARFVLIDDTTEELWVRSFIRHDGRLDNPNLRASISTALCQMRSSQLRTAAVTEFDRITPGNRASERPTDAITEDAGTPSGRHARSTDRQDRQTENLDPRPTTTTPGLASLSPVAAAAVEVVVVDGLRNPTKPIKSPTRFAQGIRRNVLAEHGDALARVAADADPVDTVVAVLGWDRSRAIEADYHRRRNGATP